MVAEAQRVVGEALHERAAGLDRALHVPAEVRLGRHALERVGADRQRRLPVLERLPVTARGGRRARRPRGEAADRVPVARPASVVGEPCRIVAPDALQSAQHAPVELAPARGGDAVLDGAAGEVVPERQRVPRTCTSPAATHSSIASAPSSISHSSTVPGTTDASSTTVRAGSLNAPSRSAIASRPASASATKNGLPPVTACRSPGSRPACAASAATAAGAQRPRLAPARRAARPAPAAPRSARPAAWSGSTRRRPPGARPARRDRASRRRPSAGPRSPASSARARPAWRSGPPRASRSASACASGGTRRAMSCHGPIGRGVISGSQTPHSASGGATARTSSVLPIPASPVTTAIRPASMAACSAARSSSLSSSSNLAQR